MLVNGYATKRGIRVGHSLLDRLICWYDCEDFATATLWDQHTNAIHLAATGASVSNSTIDGKPGRAREFTGDDYAISDRESLRVNTQFSYTVCAWAQVTSVSVQRGIVCRWDWPNHEWALWMNDTPRFVFSNNGTDGNAIHGTTVSINTWYFVIGWYDASIGQLGIEVDNAGTVTDTATGTLKSPSAFTVGAVAAGTDLWSGRIDSVGYWKRMLTPYERGLLYNNGRGLKYPFNRSS